MIFSLIHWLRRVVARAAKRPVAFPSFEPTLEYEGGAGI